MRKLFQLILLVLFIQHGISQETKFLNSEILIGGIIPKGNEISKVYGQGLSSEFRLNKNFGDYIMVKPFFNYSFFANYPNDYQLENIHFLTLGLNADLMLKIKSEMILYFGPSVCANHYFDYLDWADKNLLDYNSNNIVMSGNILSYEVRFGVNYKQFIFELNYRPLKSEPNYNNAFKSLKSDKLYKLYNLNYKTFDLTMFSINIGVKL